MSTATKFLQPGLWIFLALATTFAATCRAGTTVADHATTLVPNGWAVEETTQGDLTGDGIVDKVLTLLSKKPRSGEDGMEHPRMLLVLAGTKSGSYKVLASSKNLLLCQECFGVLGGGPQISVTKKHVLIIDQMAGSRETEQGIWRFRIDHGTGKLRLIGLDVWYRDRGTGASTLTSTNYLTGKQIKSEYQFSEAKNKDAITHTKTLRVPVSKTYLEQTNSKSMDDG